MGSIQKKKPTSETENDGYLPPGNVSLLNEIRLATISANVAIAESVAKVGPVENVDVEVGATVEPLVSVAAADTVVAADELGAEFELVVTVARAAEDRVTLAALLTAVVEESEDAGRCIVLAEALNRHARGGGGGRGGGDFNAVVALMPAESENENNNKNISMKSRDRTSNNKKSQPHL